MFQSSSSQGSLWESEFQMSDRKRGRLEKTWGKVFRERCWPMIDEEVFRPLYCADNGAPCKSVRLVVAVTILRHLFDLTHEETQYHVDFDLRWHLALGLDPCADNDYVSERTLRYFEAKLVVHELVGVLFAELTDRLVARLGVKTGRQRLDTTHLLSNVARLSRLGLFCETHRVLLKALRREDALLLERLPVSLLRRYLREDGTDSSYDDARASDSRRRLGVAARDAWRLREALRGVALPADSATAYVILDRLVEEHCEIVADPQVAAGDDADADLAPVPVVVKASKELTGAVLQTPHDPGVTYSGHKGQGYEGLIAETCDAENPVQLITHVSLERSCESDADRVLPTVETLIARDCAPDTLLADTSFGSQANYEACAERGIELIAPIPGAGGEAPADEDAEAGFRVQCFPDDLPSVCPAGVEAAATVVRESSTGPVALLQMPVAACDGCACRTRCPLLTTEDGQTVALLEIGETLRDDRRAFVQTAAFQEAYRPRAGIEATNSELKRGQGLGDLRVRGQARVAFALTMRALACNVKRAMQYWGKQAKNAVHAAHLVWSALVRSPLHARCPVCGPGGTREHTVYAAA
jgi:hypothetical protein